MAPLNRWHAYRVADRLIEALQDAQGAWVAVEDAALLLDVRFRAVTRALGYPIVKPQAGTRGPTRTLSQYLVDHLTETPDARLEVARLFTPSAEGGQLRPIIRCREVNHE